MKRKSTVQLEYIYHASGKSLLLFLCPVYLSGFERFDESVGGQSVSRVGQSYVRAIILPGMTSSTEFGTTEIKREFQSQPQEPFLFLVSIINLEL